MSSDSRTMGPEHRKLEKIHFPVGTDADSAGRFIDVCRPGVSRYWRFLLAGMVWLIVGIALILAACQWLALSQWPVSLVLALISLGFGIAVAYFGFSRIAGRNIARIQSQTGPACLFSFQGWNSYFLIVVMMALGYALRHLPIPKSIDAVIYFTVGSGLALSSSLYFNAFMKE